MAGQSVITDKHPEYTENFDSWTLMRDAYKGQRAIKSKNATYLPYTTSHIIDGVNNPNQIGWKAYQAYKARARFPNFTREAVQMALGMMHSEPPEITLPPSMEGVRSRRGETLEQLLRRINMEQLIQGRLGLLVDLPTTPLDGDDTPYIATYTAERIINWDDGELSLPVPQSLNLVVLDETEHVRDETFSWEEKARTRILTLGAIKPNERSGRYRFAVVEEDEEGFDESKLRPLRWRGRELNHIPFTIINSVDLVADVDDPPLLDLANLCINIYMAEADYRQNLHMQGQDTFVTIGYADADASEGGEIRTGAGSWLNLPLQGDAKYVGVKSDGLKEQRESLENDRGRAGSMGAQTLDTVSRERESGRSLNTRMAARTADLKTIAVTGASGLEKALRDIAMLMGEDPELVTVTPNLEFTGEKLTPQSMVEMAAARNQQFPISAKSLHEQARKRGMTDMTYEEEMEAIKAEKGTPAERMVESLMGNGDRNPDQPASGETAENGGNNGQGEDE